MQLSNWLDGVRKGWVRFSNRNSTSLRKRISTRIEPLEVRQVLAEDFGDAPDTGSGTGPGNYNTTLADGGPHHTIVSGIQLGTNIDGEANATANTRANGDDSTTSPDDEDGVVNPLSMQFTVGTQPSVRLRATNGLSTDAMLSGWIDFNNNGLFDNATERAQAVVPKGTNNGLFTLLFPVVPAGFTGKTYARFRLSTDPSAQNPIGMPFNEDSNPPAADGEVEDYQVTIVGPTSATVKTGGSTKIASATNNGPALADVDNFGGSVASIGDLDGDGVTDLAVGAAGDDTGGTNRGAVRVLFMNSSGSVKSNAKIASGTTGAPTLADNDFFGSAVVNLGDVDGDGVTDLAVGAFGDDTGGSGRGAVYVLFLNANGSVKSSTKIASGTTNGPTLANSDYFGCAVTSLGDMDGDGITELAVGAFGDDTGGTYRGAVYILRLNASGAVKSSGVTKIANGTNGGPTLTNADYFGNSVANLGDIDGDGTPDLAVGAYRDDTGGTNRGAVHILFLNGDGTVKSSRKVGSGASGGPTLTDNDFFGSSVASVGDLDGDGITDLVVGSFADDTGGTDRGAVHVLFLNSTGSVKSSQKLASGTNGVPTLTNSDQFGSAVTSLGDLDGDGAIDLAVGALRDDTGGNNRGAVYVLKLNTATALKDFGDAPDASNGTGAGNYQTRNADGGPSHVIANGILLGPRISGETDATVNSTASGDDLGIDDEDGVINPLLMQFTTGTQPVVQLRATNQTGTNAVLTGWIDYNNNGQFDNASERAQVVVGTGISNGIVTLTFPTVPTGFTGKTYARFRISTDIAAQNPTGAASNGEVEDYAVTIVGPGAGFGKFGANTKIASGTNGGPTLANSDRFGESVAYIGDVNGDGIGDLAVGAPRDDSGGTDRGAVYILFLNAAGTVQSITKIPGTIDSNFIGSSVAALGDVDGDGIPDLAVGFNGYDAPSTDNGALAILRLNADGSVKSSHAFFAYEGISTASYFGSSVSSVGDLDGDGIADLAVGSPGADIGGTDRGELWIVLMNLDGSARSAVRIDSASNGGPSLADGDAFGVSVANLGDLDGDGVTDLAVGAYKDDTGGTDRGAVYILHMNANGTVKSSTKIASNTAGGPSLGNDDRFGTSVANVGDLDGDGITDLAVGAYRDDTDGTDRGAVYILRLKADGTVKSSIKIANLTNGGPTLTNSDRFGSSVTNIGDLDGDGFIDLAVGAHRDNTGGTDRGAVYIIRMNGATGPLEDLGDAPDASDGTAPGNYQTSYGDDGPSHGIINGLLLGARISGETNAAANTRANGDDLGIDDEDGVLNPLQLQLTAGTQPVIALRVTNQTGRTAVLFGWIDYNRDGVFDNNTERTVTIIPSGASNQTVNLTFPSVPAGASGATYARFRLSTDAASGNPTGALSDGEVEDYAVAMTKPGDGRVKPNGITRVASSTNGGPALANSDQFGQAVVNLGDFDNDGIPDLAVGAYQDDTGGTNRGAIYIQLLNADGTVKASTKIASGTNGGPTLADDGRFGVSLANLGDLNGDGVNDLAVGAYDDGTGGNGRGAVYILFMNANRTVNSITKIASDVNGAPTLPDRCNFGASVASLGDLDGDGVTDLVVGAHNDSTVGEQNGAVYILFLNPNGSVKSSTKIASGINGGPALPDVGFFGRSAASLGDLDGDGVTDLVVGAYRDYTGGSGRGAVYILRLNSSGTVKSSTKIASGTNGGPTLANGDLFGRSVVGMGDLNGDGVPDLAVGAIFDRTGGTSRGAVHVLLMNSDGTVKSSLKIASGTNGGPALANFDTFGHSLANMGDLNGDGLADLAVGSPGDDTGGDGRGAIYLLQLDANAAPTAIGLTSTSIAENQPAGTAIGTFTTTDPNAGNTFTYTLVSGAGSTDNASFQIVGSTLQSSAVFNFEAKNSFSIRVRTTDQGGLSFEQALTITITDVAENVAPVVNNSGNPYYIAGVGQRLPTELTSGILITDLLARGASGTITDGNSSDPKGIAITAVDKTYGKWQYASKANPAESDWTDVDAGSAVSDSSALLLKADATTRIRMISALTPHHEGTPNQGFIPLESKLTSGITFRAWDQTTGTAGQRGNTSTNGGTSAFSTASETLNVFFEARLWRSFNTNASLNVYTLEAEFNALTASPAYQDRATGAYTGFTIFLSPLLATLPTASLYRMYYGVQFNDDGTETDMGYRYLTTSEGEAQFLENAGPASKRPQRAGTYFREQGVNNGTGIIGYIYSTSQPGTAEMSQIYRTDLAEKPTRPGGTAEGSAANSVRSQELGDHVYTTNKSFEKTKAPGTLHVDGVSRGWREEAARGFVRELTPNPSLQLPVNSPVYGDEIGSDATGSNATMTITVSPSLSTILLPETLFTGLQTASTSSVSTPVPLALIAPPVEIDLGTASDPVPGISPAYEDDSPSAFTADTTDLPDSESIDQFWQSLATSLEPALLA